MFRHKITRVGLGKDHFFGFPLFGAQLEIVPMSLVVWCSGVSLGRRLVADTAEDCPSFL